MTDLASPVDIRVVQTLLPCDRVPNLLTINLRMLLGIHNGSKRWCDHYSFHGGGMCFDGSQNTSGSLDGGVKEILHWVLNVEMERRGGMKNIVEWRAWFDGLIAFALVVYTARERPYTDFIKCAVLGYVFDNHIRKFLLRDLGMSIKNQFALLLWPDSNDCIKTRVKKSVRMNACAFLFQTCPCCNRISIMWAAMKPLPPRPDR